MKLETFENLALVVGTFAAFAIAHWVFGLGLGWTIGVSLLWVFFAAAVIQFVGSERSYRTASGSTSEGSSTRQHRE